MGLRSGLSLSTANSAGDPLVFVFTGESNSGGQALNSAATAGELVARSSLQILNNTSLEFDSLDIGTNNNIDHANLDPSLYHGFELGLANEIEGGEFSTLGGVRYLIKTGQGGSTIAQWDEGQTYWTKFLTRINAAKALLKPQCRWVVGYSQGINDVIAGTATATWKAATIAHLAKIKTALPGCLIVMTEFQDMVNGSAAYDTAIQEIADAYDDVTSVDTTGFATDGGNHWSYAGFKDSVVPAMIAATLGFGVL